MDRLEREEKMANIAKAKSEIFRNYTLGFATLATMLKILFRGGYPLPHIILRGDENDKLN
ncbi:hypothetical protein [Staphylococcus schweitzeri]|uniref:hypothetical protein n=1 Tax=Staphylococcus schweitzeri TaxID=1654388 RepID=UPI000504C4F6|nr:hypothetical protein [Staphylococcus schweitzeri]CDR51904.1 hypothetical protein ERS140159_01865 [Staphylococcus schweitzeri]